MITYYVYFSKRVNDPTLVFAFTLVAGSQLAAARNKEEDWTWLLYRATVKHWEIKRHG